MINSDRLINSRSKRAWQVLHCALPGLSMSDKQVFDFCMIVP